MMVFVIEVPMLAPMTIHTALATGSGFSGAATRPTIIEVVTDELCISVVARIPTISAMKGFSVAAKKAPSTSFPNSLNPSPSPWTPSRKKNNSTSTCATLFIPLAPASHRW